MTTPTNDEKELEEILRDYEHEVTGIPKHWDKTDDRRATDRKYVKQLQAWRDREVVKARLNMVEYYDQCTSNEQMDWKGLFADNRKTLQHELEATLKQDGEAA